jgi:uncharacterized protein (TIGR00369 family)
MEVSQPDGTPAEQGSGESLFLSDLEAGGARLVPGHAFEAFEWRVVADEAADWVMEMEVTPRVVNSSGALQGGLLATLIDSVAGMSVMRDDPTGGRPVTSEMQVSYLAGARVGPVRATAQILHRGRRSAVVRVDVRDVGAGDLNIATGTLRFALVGPREAAPVVS